MIPSLSMRLLNRGFRFLWLRTMSTERPIVRSKKSLASMRTKGLGVCVSTNKSTSLASPCSFLAIEPNRRTELMPYLSRSVRLHCISRPIHSFCVIPFVLFHWQRYAEKTKRQSFRPFFCGTRRLCQWTMDNVGSTQRRRDTELLPYCATLCVSAYYFVNRPIVTFTWRRPSRWYTLQ